MGWREALRRRPDPTGVLILGLGLAFSILAALVAAQAVAQTAGGYADGSSIGGQIVVPGSGTGSTGTGTGSTGTGTGGGGSGGGGPAPTCTGPTDPTDYDSPAQTGEISYTATPPGLTEALNSGAGGSEVRSRPPSPDAKGTWYTRWCGTAPRGFGGYVWAPEGTSPAAVAAPPAPPTMAEIRDRTPLPLPAFGVAPTIGLAGAQSDAKTALWDDNGAGGRTVNLTLRGYTVVVRSNPGEWRWNPGGGAGVIVTTRPGTATDPAVQHTYSTAGTYTVTLDVTWSGSYTYSGNGSAAQTVSLPATTRSASVDHRVDAVQPVLEGMSPPRGF